MPKHRVEIFGQFIYSPEISYHGLLELECSLKDFVDSTLGDSGAEYIHFESEGDRTFFQCVFPEFDKALFEQIAGDFAKRTNSAIECKLFFVDKMLEEALLYRIANTAVKTDQYTLRAVGPIDKNLRRRRE